MKDFWKGVLVGGLISGNTTSESKPTVSSGIVGGDRKSKPLDPAFAQTVYRDLYQRLTEALRNNAPRGLLVEEIITAIDDPFAINQVFVRRFNWWDRFTGSKEPAYNIGSSMRAFALIDYLQESGVSTQTAVTYLFDQIRSNSVQGATPLGIHIYPEEYEDSRDNSAGPSAWETPSADWLAPEVVGLASAILDKLRSDSGRQ